jgi:hypothetical protein
MTVPDLLARLPQMRRMFPKELGDWSLQEFLSAQVACERRVWEALKRWREENQSPEKENDINNLWIH